MPNPDKAGPEVLDEEEAMEDVIDLLGAGLRDLDARAAQTREAASAIPDAALEELTLALRAAPLFNGVSTEGMRILVTKARRVSVAAFQSLIDSEKPEEALLGEHGLLIAQELLIIDLPWLKNLAAGQHLGEGGWLGDGRMTNVNSQDEGAALIIDQALSELGLSAEDQLQIGFNALCNSPLADDNARLAENAPDELPSLAGDNSLEPIATEAAERLGLDLFECNPGELISPKPGHILLGLSGLVNVHAPDSNALLSQISFPNLCFEVNGAGGKTTANIVAHTRVRAYWLPLAAEQTLQTEDLLALLKLVRKSHGKKLGLANDQVRKGMHAHTDTPKEEGALAGILNFFKRLNS